jgi:membrane protein implicated in regulation of membrane protease activity
MEPGEQPPTSAPVDRGLDSIADLRALTRLLFFGLAGIVIVGAVVTILAHKWSVLLILVVAYVVIAAIQWVAVHHRLAGKRNPR